jgi:hypothetical protein
MKQMPKKGKSLDASDKQLKYSKDVEPNRIYTTEKPSNKKHDIMPPKTKYFSPLSVENSDFLLNVANT